MNEVRFGGYRVVETIGSGALATLYKAEQESLGRTVAIKALKSTIAPTSSFAAQIDREARVLGELFHANVVLLVDYRAGEDGRPSFLVLEYVDGPSLAELVARRRVLRPEAAAAIAYQVAEGLAHAHERGVVHRDIKPQNVLLSRRGDVKIIDFGIAQRERLPSVAEPLPRGGGPEKTHEAFGTPAYMSPEQILGDTVDARSDLFSLGVILYRMLTGTRPFEREGDPKSPGRGGAERLRRDAPVPFRERAPDVPRPLERTVMKLLQKNPEDRHTSARELAEELAAFLRSFSGASPQRLVVAALTEAGYVKEEGTRRAEPHVARRSQLALPSVRTTWLGFAGIGVAFLLFAGLSEVLARDSRTVRAAGSKPLELAPEQSGSLRVLATPWAEVAVDGQHVDTTPFARAIPLPPGPHFVSLTHPNAKPENRQIVIRANEVVTVDVTLDLGEGADAGTGAQDASTDARADASRAPSPSGSEKPASSTETHAVP